MKNIIIKIVFFLNFLIKVGGVTLKIWEEIKEKKVFLKISFESIEINKIKIKEIFKLNLKLSKIKNRPLKSKKKKKSKKNK